MEGQASGQLEGRATFKLFCPPGQAASDQSMQFGLESETCTPFYFCENPAPNFIARSNIGRKDLFNTKNRIGLLKFGAGERGGENRDSKKNGKTNKLRGGQKDLSSLLGKILVYRGWKMVLRVRFWLGVLAFALVYPHTLSSPFPRTLSDV